MIQVRIIDENGYYTGKVDFVEEVTENMVVKPMMIGYVRPCFIDGEWVEGATEEEIKEWQDSQPKVNNVSTDELLTQLIINQLQSTVAITVLFLY